MKKAVVIGSGIAGLAAAIRLSAKGYSVDVYEKNAFPGGKLSVFQKDGFTFDVGPSLFTEPQNIEDLFKLCGEDIRNYFNYRPVHTTCNYFFENGIHIIGHSDIHQFSTELVSKAGEKADVLKYLKNAAKLYENIGAIFLNFSLHKYNTWLHRRVIKAMGYLKLTYLTTSLHRYNEKYFTSDEARQIFNRFATYNGSNPYRSPAMLSLIAHVEFNDGVYYPKGGMISITNALFALAQKMKVTFHFNQPVQQLVISNGVAKGVLVNDTQIDADCIVTNVDVFYAYRDHIKNKLKANKVLKQERSSSAVVFYWGINKLFDQLHLHNIFFSKQYEEEFSAIFNGTTYADPTIYINITSKMETIHAPTGMENWFVMVNVPADTGQDWDAEVLKIKDAVIKKLNRMLQVNLCDFIVTETILHPKLIDEKFASYAGAIYGTSSNSPLAAFVRHANFSNTIKNLYFCGGTVHPGGGIPLCLKSAKITSSLIK